LVEIRVYLTGVSHITVREEEGIFSEVGLWVLKGEEEEDADDMKR